MSKKKKTKLYDTVRPPDRPNLSHRGLMVRDPNDPICYTWYCLVTAVIDGRGQIVMETA